MADELFQGLVLEVADDDEDFIPLDQSQEHKEEETQQSEQNNQNNQKEAEGTEQEESAETGGSRQTEEESREEGEHKDQGSPDAVSPIALAALNLKEIGALRTLGDEDIKAIKTESDLDEAFEKEVLNRTDSLKKQIEALRSGVSINRSRPI